MPVGSKVLSLIPHEEADNILFSHIYSQKQCIELAGFNICNVCDLVQRNSVSANDPTVMGYSVSVRLACDP